MDLGGTPGRGSLWKSVCFCTWSVSKSPCSTVAALQVLQGLSAIVSVYCSPWGSLHHVCGFCCSFCFLGLVGWHPLLCLKVLCWCHICGGWSRASLGSCVMPLKYRVLNVPCRLEEVLVWALCSYFHRTWMVEVVLIQGKGKSHLCTNNQRNHNARLAYIYWFENAKADGHILIKIPWHIKFGGWFLLTSFSYCRAWLFWFLLQFKDLSIKWEENCVTVVRIRSERKLFAAHE